MGWLIALAVLILIGSIPVGASLRYGQEKFQMKIRLGVLNLSLPAGGGEKKKKEAPEKKKKEPQDDGMPPPPPRKKEKVKRPLKDLIEDYMPFVKLAFSMLGSLRRKLRIEKLYAKLVLAGGDPCTLATNYGRTWAAVGTLMGNLNQILVIEDQDVDVQCDFEGSKTRVEARVDLTISIGRALGLAVHYGALALKQLIILKNRKGGAVK